MELFNAQRMIRSADVPTFHCHGTRHVEFLDGGFVRSWLGIDLPAIPGQEPRSVPVVAIIVPVACYIWNLLAQTEYAFDRGAFLKKPSGPGALRPSRVLMH